MSKQKKQIQKINPFIDIDAKKDWAIIASAKVPIDPTKVVAEVTFQNGMTLITIKDFIKRIRVYLV